MRRFLILISLLIGILFFAWAIHSTNLNEVKKALMNLSWQEIVLVIFILFLSQIILSAFRLFYIFSLEGNFLNFKDVLLTKIIGFALSYLTPISFFGGEPAMYLFLKRKTKIPSRKIISTIALERIIFTTTSLIYFFVGIFIFLLFLPLTKFTRFIFSGVLSIIFLLGVFFVFRLKNKIAKNGIFLPMIKKLYLGNLKIFKKNEEAIKEIEKEIGGFFNKTREEILKAFSISLIEIFFFIFGCWLIVVFLEKNLEFFKIFAINSMVILSSIMPLPANLGSLEIGQGFAFQFFGLKKETGITFSLILRGIELFFSAIGLWFFFHSHLKMLKDENKN